MSEEITRITGGERPPAREQPYGEHLTPEEYEKLAPLLRLADLGRTEKLAETLKPGELKRRELKRRAIEGLREHGTVTHAAAAAGVAVKTLYNWRDADPEFAALVTEFMHVDQVAELHESLYKIATTPNEKTATAAVRAGEFLLKALDRPTYGDQLRTEGTQTVNHIVQIATTTRDDLRAQQAQRLAQLQARTIDAPKTEEEV